MSNKALENAKKKVELLEQTEKEFATVIEPIKTAFDTVLSSFDEKINGANKSVAAVLKVQKKRVNAAYLKLFGGEH